MESLAEDQHDPQLVNMLRSKYLKEQVDSIAEIAKLMTQLNRVGGDGLGLHLFDQVNFYRQNDMQLIWRQIYELETNIRLVSSCNTCLVPLQTLLKSGVKGVIGQV